MVKLQLVCVSCFLTLTVLPILSQLTTPLPVNPSKQRQLMVLVGVVEWTLHCALATHGAIVVHGSTHLFLPPVWQQISKAGQSTSSLQSCSSTTGSGTTFRKNVTPSVSTYLQKNSHLDHIQQSMDHLCSQVCKCTCLCDSQPHSQHFQHKHMDLHIFHSCKIGRAHV